MLALLKAMLWQASTLGAVASSLAGAECPCIVLMPLGHHSRVCWRLQQFCCLFSICIQHTSVLPVCFVLFCITPARAGCKKIPSKLHCEGQITPLYQQLPFSTHH